jgi:hypothetical protein
MLVASRPSTLAMTRTSLQAITWGTVSAAVVSAMLLAAAGDDAAEWRFEPPGAGVRPAPLGRSGSTERLQPVQPPNERSSQTAAPR